jgi:hypothetical protein
MKPQSSLPRSQPPPLATTVPYPDPRWLQSTPSHPVHLRPTLKIFSHQHLGIQSDNFPSDFPTKILYEYKWK